MDNNSYLKSMGLNPAVIQEVPIPEELVYKYPFEGIIYIGGKDHLNKAMSFCKKILETQSIYGSIDRLESWETGQYRVDHKSCSLLLITNVVKGLFFENNLITELNMGFGAGVPILITSCNTIEEFEKDVSKTLISIIEPYFIGMI